MYFKKTAVLVLGIIMISTLCSFLDLFFGSSLTPSTKMAHKITKEIGQNLNRKYGLHFLGISEEGPDGKYKCIGLELSSNRILTKDQGRILLLNCAQDALRTFNSYPGFEKYMANVPFSNDNIIIKIYIQPPNNPDVAYPNIGIFSFFNSKLRYKTFSPGAGYHPYSTEMETFEEAKKIVEEQMNSR